MSKIIELKNVNKWFDKFQALKDVNLEVNQQEKIVICGPSGSGKSTLIRCINRLEEHQDGQIIVDGNDADEMYRTAQAAIKKARDGDGPSLIEAKTYRHSGHSRADPGKYRPDEEVKDWMENRDPITNYRKRLLEFNIDEKIISKIENKVKEQVEEATEISKASPIPDVKEIFTDVWADGGYKWHN